MCQLERAEGFNQFGINIIAISYKPMPLPQCRVISFANVYRQLFVGVLD